MLLNEGCSDMLVVRLDVDKLVVRLCVHQVHYSYWMTSDQEKFTSVYLPNKVF
ncbi:hypothetical protein UPYG_G00154370 [Umbra pygmaea]|uniref:Uncharacterized protein n=1 Tax=Umbra pygmaea TaxID=75934 RepID=A0ABD0WXT0_UMBPY